MWMFHSNQYVDSPECQLILSRNEALFHSLSLFVMVAVLYSLLCMKSLHLQNVPSIKMSQDFKEVTKIVITSPEMQFGSLSAMTQSLIPIYYIM